MIVTRAPAAAVSAISGDGPPQRRAAVLRAIDAIVDPCSEALGRPVGLVGMGIIERVDVDEGRVSVTVLPTFPTCMFRGVFEEEIEARLRAIPWCEAVSVRFAPADAIWDESRLSAAARSTLRRGAATVETPPPDAGRPALAE